MINTQQFVAILIFINIFIGGVIGATVRNQDEYEYMYNRSNKVFGDVDQFRNLDDETSFQQGEESYDKSVGNTFTGGKIIWGLISGAVAIPLVYGAKTPIEKLVAYLILIYQLIIWVYGAILLYDKIKNKKVD